MLYADSLIGQRFGRLVVVEQNQRGGLLRCACDCGVSKWLRRWNVTHGLTRSCGCLLLDTLRKHGRSATAEYRAWVSIRVRCLDQKPSIWSRYGARGISVCSRWAGPDCFTAFLQDMGPRPSPKHEIERIDNDGNYEPGNCCWATRQRQLRNTSQNVNITIGGETLCAKAWSDRNGIPAHIIRRRIHDGWPAERAVTAPRNDNVGAKRPRNRFT